MKIKLILLILVMFSCKTPKISNREVQDTVTRRPRYNHWDKPYEIDKQDSNDKRKIYRTQTK